MLAHTLQRQHFLHSFYCYTNVFAAFFFRYVPPLGKMPPPNIKSAVIVPTEWRPKRSLKSLSPNMPLKISPISYFYLEVRRMTRNCLSTNATECSLFQLALVWPCTSDGRTTPSKFRNGSHLFDYLYGRRSPDDPQKNGDPWADLVDLFETVVFNRDRKYNNLHLNNKISGSRRGGLSCYEWIATFTKDHCVILFDSLNRKGFGEFRWLFGYLCS